MLIQSLKQHFPARFPEWLMSGVMATWGAYVILHPQLFTAPTTAALLAGLASMSDWTGYTPAAVWGLCALVVGLFRAAALFVNGAYARTPIVRLIASFISAFIWTQITIGLMRIEVPNTGLVVYGWLVIADVASAYRASLDVVVAESHRIQAKEGPRRAVGRR